jgi:magnesium-transporting ATPase (P-type)
MFDNLRISTRKEQENNSKGIMEGTKRERKHNAKPLPNEITRNMMKKYVVYYHEWLNKEKTRSREFFKIDPEHVKTTLSTIGSDDSQLYLKSNISKKSTRKRMSVIVKCPDNKIRLYIKGADSVLRDRISLNKNLLEINETHMQEFAQHGLRTLMIAYREISEYTMIVRITKIKQNL